MIGDWAGLFNHVKLGGLMQKGLTLRSSMCPMQARWPGVGGRRRSGALPTRPGGADGWGMLAPRQEEGQHRLPDAVQPPGLSCSFT